MAASTNSATSSLMDWVRPSEADGPLVGAVLSTYGLSLDQPDFFGQDFLPTLLGLGGVRDRGYASPVTLDRTLATSDVTLICDAHALTAGVRPTLRIDVLPIGHTLQHAKVSLIHRHNRIRLIVASANLTHEGFRRQREAAVVLDFHEGGSLSPEVLDQAIKRWEEVLGATADEQVRRILAAAASRASQWKAAAKRADKIDLQVVFGGGTNPLWRQLVDVWPKGESVQSWHVCSPFWPQVDRNAAGTPFDAIAQALQEKACSLADCDLEIIARADTASPNALPRFPFALVDYLRKNGFPVTRGRILPARLDASDDEVPQGMAAENRDLHAKWIVLAGRESVVALIGSANFTRQGLGVLRDPSNANIEAGVLLKWPRGKWHPKEWRPPIQGRTIDWATCSVVELRDPPPEEDKAPEWAEFIQKIEMSIRWERLPDPDGELRVHLRPTASPAFSVTLPPQSGGDLSPLVAVQQQRSPICFAVPPEELRAILARRVVEVRWSDDKYRCFFPVNVLHESKAGMPSILGAKPTEEQLLAYFHGRISEEDLLSRLERQAQESGGHFVATAPEDAEKLRRLQSYVVREFVESLYGLSRTLQDGCFSPRSAEQAFLGDLSPVCLGEQVLQAFMAGKRSPAAAGFQLAELIRVVCEVVWPVAASSSPETRQALEGVRRRTIDRLFALCEQASVRTEFASVIRDSDFTAFVRTMLPADLASRWAAVLPREASRPVANQHEVIA